MRMVSKFKRNGAAIRTRPVGGYTLRCRFLISFCTTSTVIFPSFICFMLILGLLLYNFKNPFYFIYIFQEFVQCCFDHPFYWLISFPVIWFYGDNFFMNMDS